MARSSPTIKLEEQSGNKFPDLASAQRSARPLLASSLADVTRRLLADGVLIIQNGKIIPNPQRTNNA